MQVDRRCWQVSDEMKSGNVLHPTDQSLRLDDASVKAGVEVMV